MSNIKRPVGFVLDKHGIPEAIAYPDDSPEERAERKKISAKCGHVKRRLVRNERLTGEVLDFAVSVVGEDTEIADKLKAGQPLTDYELHLMLDVHLLRKRLSG